MRRADRLFEIVQLIRGRRTSTGAQLAARLGVSLRTVYRDIADLQAQGVPIEGEAGVGYRLGSGYALPPLMFSAAEAAALVAAVRVAEPWLDAELAVAAGDALGKVRAVLPPGPRTAADSLRLHAPPVGLDAAAQATLQRLREAAQQRQRQRIDYRDGEGRDSHRTVRPLGCFYWGTVWTLAAWCELRGAFRSLRVDRIAALQPAGPFADEAGRTLADYLRQVRAQHAAERPGAAPGF